MKGILNRALIANGLLLLMAGCGGSADNLPATVDASGVVLLDGSPVHGASVVFSPVEPGKYPAFSITDSRGRFDLKAFEAKDGAVPGSYQVQVSKTVEVAASAPGGGGNVAPGAADEPKGGMWKNDLPDKYANPATSQITVEIPASGRTDFKIELVTKP